MKNNTITKQIINEAEDGIEFFIEENICFHMTMGMEIYEDDNGNEVDMAKDFEKRFQTSITAVRKLIEVARNELL